ncbi:ABC-type dipeptide oligopeptide nickel transport system, permease component [Apilactobacillus ozensis DSM 23829 = JCM 17196]|uniref:ABC-type dipeptide oligopeptide nickel transport system, permease component n=1 Tax=Apilactobacillus ozensis DSM 23829 = JCM 17196 TaxID=1423781 RepID=A0A0R2AX69_9LACO|nr:ABC transporter permease [Apilactobacillus ozensis]KRM68230.1 ABC-type dipeptide oligopeptide nickel transport system, permease component [Apilactobacillus ozensis DSM 23829 = JCM 17196]
MADNANKLPKDAFEPLSDGSHLDNERIAAPSLTFLKDSWRRLKKNKAAMISMYIVIFFVVLAFGSQLIPSVSNIATHPNLNNLPPRIPGIDIPGFNGTLVQGGQRVNAYTGDAANVHYWLGSDYLGRDLLARTLSGTRISLIIAMVATFFDLTIGVTYGIISGWKGGRVDTIMQRIIEIMLSVPNLVVMILLLLLFKPGIGSIVLVLAFTGWINMARLVRAQTLELKSQEFVLAARSLGQKPWKIAFKHLLPNLSSVIIVNTMLTIPNAIFFEAFLSFIGIGVPAPAASLGTLISDGQKSFQYLPYQMWIPAIVLSLLMIAFNILGDGLRDAFDPRTRE